MPTALNIHLPTLYLAPGVSPAPPPASPAAAAGRFVASCLAVPAGLLPEWSPCRNVHSRSALWMSPLPICHRATAVLTSQKEGPAGPSGYSGAALSDPAAGSTGPAVALDRKRGQQILNFCFSLVFPARPSLLVNPPDCLAAFLPASSWSTAASSFLYGGRSKGQFWCDKPLAGHLGPRGSRERSILGCGRAMGEVLSKEHSSYKWSLLPRTRSLRRVVHPVCSNLPTRAAQQSNTKPLVQVPFTQHA